MQNTYVEMLKNIPIFGGIRLEVLQLMLDHSNVVNKSKGDYFFRENELAGSMFVLLKGNVEITKTWRDKSYTIAQLLPGDCFGEMAIIDHCTRSANVIAVEDCQAIELTIECFNEIYLEDIKQYTMLQMNMGREVSRRLREANDLLFQSKIEHNLKDDIYVRTV